VSTKLKERGTRKALKKRLFITITTLTELQGTGTRGDAMITNCEAMDDTQSSTSSNQLISNVQAKLLVLIILALMKANTTIQ